MNYVDYYLHYKKLFVGSRGWEPAQRCITLKQGGGDGKATRAESMREY
jgi:hypothetical protein